MDAPSSVTAAVPLQRPQKAVTGRWWSALRSRVAGRPVHWMVLMNARYRVLFFALLFVVLLPFLHNQDAKSAQWVLLTLSLLVYPWIALARASLARRQVRAEMQHLQFDAFLFGVWIAFWGFPLWVTFCLFVAVTLNGLVFTAFRGLAKSLGALVIGVGVGIAFCGVHFNPTTSLTTTIFCMLGLTAYLWNFAYDTFARGVALRESRTTLTSQLAEITDLQCRLERQANSDALTGLFNRRYLDTTLQSEFERCQQDDQPLTLLMVDIDHFKRVNDTYGHQAGDEVLQALARVLTAHTGPGETTFRYGGEEFLMMLPGMTTEVAIEHAELLSRECAARPVTINGEPLNLTLSFGIATSSDKKMVCSAELVHLADRALYAAKLGGRNRIVSVADCTATTDVRPSVEIGQHTQPSASPVFPATRGPVKNPAGFDSPTGQCRARTASAGAGVWANQAAG